MPLYYGPLLMT